MLPQEAIRKLFDAAKRGNVIDAEAALAAGADANARISSQETPLHCAAEKGHTDMARLLIDKGADPNATNDSLVTPLHNAALFGRTDIARLLIDKGADVNASNSSQETPLHSATLFACTDTAKLLIAKGADPNARDKTQRTPLDRATQYGHIDLADMLSTAQRWHTYLKPLLGADQKLDVRQLVDEAGQPTKALKNLLPNDLFGDLARPDFYRQGMDGLVQVFPYLPEAVQATIDLTPWRRAMAQDGNEKAEREGGGFERYSRRPRKPPSEVTR